MRNRLFKIKHIKIVEQTLKNNSDKNPPNEILKRRSRSKTRQDDIQTTEAACQSKKAYD